MPERNADNVFELENLIRIWGSAFCIQFKRLLQDDKNVDPVELMRREREELEEELKKDMENCDIEESESSDDENINEKGMHGEKTTGGLQRKRSKSTKLKQKSFWDSVLSRMMETRWFQSIELRAAQIFNFMRGLSLNNVFPFSPFTKTQEEENENNKSTFGGIFDLHPTHIKKLYVVDSGLTFNSPYPVLLRPQREVDIILSFDFSARASDDTPPFKELLLAAKWAELNKVPFPPIDTSVIEKEGLKECYVFKHPWDPNCPIVLHFCLVNINFKREVRPGISRRTQDELDFANFSIFDDPARPYSTFKFTYSHLEFDRLSQLMEYNTLFCQDLIFDNIATCIKRRKRFSIRRPCKKKDIARLSLNNKIKADKLAEYITMVEQVSGINEIDDSDKLLKNEAGNLHEDKTDSPAELRENFEMKHRPFSLPLKLPEDDQSSAIQKEPSRRMRLTSDMSKLEEETEELDISPSNETNSHLGSGKGVLSRSRVLAKSPKRNNLCKPNRKETSNDVSNNESCRSDQSDSVFEMSSSSRLLRKTVSSTAELNACYKTPDVSSKTNKHLDSKEETGIIQRPNKNIYDSQSDNSCHPLVDWIDSANRVTHL
ncbi:Cytosolic phospholipase A2 [Bulinus truncatus]|nr:Cytosolic phospholipase A2 [Bulinus truncatus]